jgi:hypothetical protein
LNGLHQSAQEFVGKSAIQFPLPIRIKPLVYTCDIIEDVLIEKIMMNKKTRELLSLSISDKADVGLYESPSDSFEILNGTEIGNSRQGSAVRGY